MLFLISLLLFIIGVAGQNVSNITYLGKPFVGMENLPNVTLSNISKPQPIQMSQVQQNAGHVIVLDIEPGIGVSQAKVYLQLVLTPDKKAWDLSKTTPIFEYVGDSQPGLGWIGSCGVYKGVWVSSIYFHGTTSGTNFAMYLACFPDVNAGIRIWKDGYYITSTGKPTITNVDAYSSTLVLWTGDKLDSSCNDPYAFSGKSGGSNGDCCISQSDCKGSCRGDGSCATCNSKFYGWADKGLSYGDCCGKDVDCQAYCVNNRCTDPDCKRTPNLHDGYLDQCCSSNVDCQATCVNKKCTDASKCARPKGKKDGLFGDCCSANADCNTASSCNLATYKCEVLPNYCAGRKLGLKDGKNKDCCKTGNDCISASCPGGLCIGPILNCITGYETWSNKTLDSMYCCNTDSACLGACVGGICGYKSYNGCITGFEEDDDATSGAGYCCTNAYPSCMGSCNNGICGEPDDGGCGCKACTTTTTTTSTTTTSTTTTSTTTSTTSTPTPTCVGKLGNTNNKNLLRGFCCSTSNDCLGSCDDGVCGFPGGSPCYIPATTTTTAASTTSGTKPTPTSMDVSELVVMEGGVVTIVVITITTTTVITTTIITTAASIIISIFAWLFGHRDSPAETTYIPFPFPTTTTTNVILPTLTSDPWTSIPTPIPTKKCLSGYYGKQLKTGPLGYCCRDDTDCINNCRSSVCVLVGSDGSSTPPTIGATTVTSGTIVSPTSITNTITSIPTITSDIVTISSMSIPIVTTNSTVTTVTTNPTTTTTRTTPVVTVPGTTLDPTGTTTLVSSSVNTSTVSPTTPATTVPSGKTCKSGYYSKGLKNAPNGYCCATTNDCIGTCVYIPGDSYMCK